MADIKIFIYSSGNSRLHKAHPTLKILLITISSLLITMGSYTTLFYYGVLLLFGFYNSGLGLSLLLKDLKYIIIIGISLVLFQGLLTSEERLTILKTSLIYLVRIGEIILIGTLFTGTTKPEDITPGLYRIIRNKKVSENISLTLRLIPTFLISWKEIEESLNSRGLYLIRNPFRFIGSISIPLLVETFKKADSISIAMDSRCYIGWIEENIIDRKIDLILIISVILPVLLQTGKLLLPDW